MTQYPDPLAELDARLRGSVFAPGDTGYEAARPWNRSVRFEPAAVAAVADADDVSVVFGFARRNSLIVAVQATGHGAVDRGPETIVLHTASLQRCIVFPETETVRIGAGVTSEHLLAEAAPYGLAPVIGSAGTVAVVGYLTGGGVGPLASTYGLSADYVESFEIVTPDGAHRHVTPTENADLFWGVRGGKGHLGVVVEVVLKLVRQENLYAGALWYGPNELRAVLRAWATWSAALDRSVSTSAAIVRMPDAPSSPPPLAGRVTLSIRIGSPLPAEGAEALLAPIRLAAEPIIDTVATVPYSGIGRIHNEPHDPLPLAQDQLLLDSLPADAVDQLLNVAGPEKELALMIVEIRRLGGALADTPEHPSAFSFRAAAYSTSTIGIASPATASAAAALIAALRPWSSGNTLANFTPSSDADRSRMAYSTADLERLDGLRAQFDADRLLGS